MTLKAIFVGLCTLVLVTQATAATMQARATTTTKTKQSSAKRLARTTPSLEAQLQMRLEAAHKHAGTIRYFETRPWLLRSKRHRTVAHAAVKRAERGLTKATRHIAKLRLQLERREAWQEARMRPKAAICDVFGRHCRAAVSVAWCESRLDPDARNGQYLGLFQMGSHARELSGHGPTPHDQAESAHAYFVRSGKDWSPWSCKPRYGV